MVSKTLKTYLLLDMLRALLGHSSGPEAITSLRGDSLKVAHASSALSASSLGLEGPVVEAELGVWVSTR